MSSSPEFYLNFTESFFLGAFLAKFYQSIKAPHALRSFAALNPCHYFKAASRIIENLSEEVSPPHWIVTYFHSYHIIGTLRKALKGSTSLPLIVKNIIGLNDQAFLVKFPRIRLPLSSASQAPMVSSTFASLCNSDLVTIMTQIVCRLSSNHNE